MAADASAAILVLGEVLNSKRALNSARPSVVLGALIGLWKNKHPAAAGTSIWVPSSGSRFPLGTRERARWASHAHILALQSPSNWRVGHCVDRCSPPPPNRVRSTSGRRFSDSGHRSRHRVWRLNAPLAPIAGPSGNPEMRLHRLARPAVDWEDILGTRREGDDEIHFRTQPHVAARQRLRRRGEFEPTV
jgi:hypothetical protein